MNAQLLFGLGLFPVPTELGPMALNALNLELDFGPAILVDKGRDQWYFFCRELFKMHRSSCRTF